MRAHHNIRAVTSPITVRCWRGCDGGGMDETQVNTLLLTHMKAPYIIAWIYYPSNKMVFDRDITHTQKNRRKKKQRTRLNVSWNVTALPICQQNCCRRRRRQWLRAEECSWHTQHSAVYLIYISRMIFSCTLFLSNTIVVSFTSDSIIHQAICALWMPLNEELRTGG